jgi:DUF1680 family protein
MTDKYQPFSLGQVKLLGSVFQQRRDLNRNYVLSLTSQNLLRNHYFEAGLWANNGWPKGAHDGWEATCCQVRGHFLGHWLSAAAMSYAATGDLELKGRADWIVSELGRCQSENGGEWVFSIPEKYLDWVARKKGVWAPHYTIHKTLMGLVDMVKYAGNQQALEILVNAAKWFTRWTKKFSRDQMNDILDYETGGMIEAWADLYGFTGKGEHLDLVNKYDRPRLFERLLAGEDALVNMHANTTIPEAHGAARAFEVTGEKRWRQIAEAYWHFAVPARGYYATGGQTCGEIWSPPHQLAERLGPRTQEHCTVYNMMRLAEYLLRWIGDVEYADYYERNLYNGILAQQNPQDGRISYFLGTHPGAKKEWGTPTETFWCCHGTLVQAHMRHGQSVLYGDADGLTITQYIPSEVTVAPSPSAVSGAAVKIRQTFDTQLGLDHRPQSLVVNVEIDCDKPAEFEIKLRLPWWLAAKPGVQINGDRVGQASRLSLKGSGKPSSYLSIRRKWSKDTIRLELPKALTACPLPGSEDLVAFMDGPVVLAGLIDEQRTLVGDAADPETILHADKEREWGNWSGNYHTHGQGRNFAFMPIHEVIDERYTMYFPMTSLPKARKK